MVLELFGVQDEEGHVAALRDANPRNPATMLHGFLQPGILTDFNS